MRKLPLGIQTFEKLIADDYLYIDKTEYIYRLVTHGSIYFLSRPRRFGKSLTLSTLAALFEGKRELFRDLYIYDQPWNWKPWPVLHFDFSVFAEHQGAELLEQKIMLLVKEYAKQWDISLESTEYAGCFEELLNKLPEQAVILIDEYDKPILNNLMNPQKAAQVKEVLKGFYTVIKACDARVKFAFLTGVTKFAKISVFSGLNNLDDITMDQESAELCGYTEKELDKYFKADFENLAQLHGQDYEDLRIRVRDMYNGFRFSTGTAAVYNPVSVMNLIKKKEFKAWWFETGTPTYLIKLIKQKGFDITEMDSLSAPETSFSTYDVEDLKVLPILVQSGYLTIRDYQPGRNSYILGFPNREVRSAFLENLLESFTPEKGVRGDTPLYQLEDALRDNNIELFFENLDILFAKVPYDIHLPYEKYWQSLFYIIFTLMGYYIEVEYRTSRGRIDAVISLEGRVYIFEFKLTSVKRQDPEKLLEEARQQIRETDYVKRFADKSVTLLPAVFDCRDERTVVLWEVI